MGAISRASSLVKREITMRGKQIAITAVIALVVVVGFQTYQAKKNG